MYTLAASSFCGADLMTSAGNEDIGPDVTVASNSNIPFGRMTGNRHTRTDKTVITNGNEGANKIRATPDFALAADVNSPNMTKQPSFDSVTPADGEKLNQPRSDATAVVPKHSTCSFFHDTFLLSNKVNAPTSFASVIFMAGQSNSGGMR
jgi:hypothetical protein